MKLPCRFECFQLKEQDVQDIACSKETPGTKGAGEASGTGLPIGRSHGMVGGLRLVVKATLGMSPKRVL